MEWERSTLTWYRGVGCRYIANEKAKQARWNERHQRGKRTENGTLRYIPKVRGSFGSSGNPDHCCVEVIAKYMWSVVAFHQYRVALIDESYTSG